MKLDVLVIAAHPDDAEISVVAVSLKKKHIINKVEVSKMKSD
jgi:LmbE family N-acetylglucosaminyl deacetylase